MANSTDANPIWQHLLFANSNGEGVISALRTILENHDYKTYDPFPGGSGSPIGKLTRLRMFMAPPSPNWQSLFIAPNDLVTEDVLLALANALNLPFLELRLLSAEDHQITVYKSTTATSDLSALQPWLKSGLGVNDLVSAQNASPSIESKSSNQANLPPELQQFANQQGVEAKHVDKLMGRMTKRIFKKMEQQSDDASDPTQEQAKAMLSGQAQDAMSTPAAQKLKVIMSCLTVPEDWYLPDWKSLVAAYPLARQLQDGDALLLPGDEAALQQVPNALEFMPLYYAKRNA